MRNTIQLAGLNITFEDSYIIDGKQHVIVAAETADKNRQRFVIADESFKSGVLPYKPKFNAEYAIDNMPDIVSEYLQGHAVLAYFKSWLITQYDLSIRNYGIGEINNEENN